MCLVTFFLVVLVLCGEAKIGFANGNGGNYVITWKDLKIDYDHRLPLRFVGNLNKLVIVVDKNGRGDSVTVQGAVDMVPENNSQRVKIHILPGVYRLIQSLCFLVFFMHAALFSCGD